MQFKSQEEITRIGTTIRAVAEAESRRLFVPSKNSYERSLLVYNEIWSAVRRALGDAGVDLRRLSRIDPSTIILEKMAETGYHPIRVGNR